MFCYSQRMSTDLQGLEPDAITLDISAGGAGVNHMRSVFIDSVLDQELLTAGTRALYDIRRQRDQLEVSFTQVRLQACGNIPKVPELVSCRG